jgi:hypothetical protein
VNDKLQLISNIINQADDGMNYANALKQKVFLAIEIIKYYTDINFTEKQLEDPCLIYDQLINSGILTAVYDSIPDSEISALKYGLQECSNAIYAYKNSLLGLLETASADYEDLNLNADEIKDKIADPDNLALLKDVLTKLG